MSDKDSQDLSEVPSDLPDVNDVIASKGPEFAIGYDLPRVWTTGAQVFVDARFSNIVFREQSLYTSDEGNMQGLIRNVASVVMPTDMARQLRDLLTTQLEALDGQQEG